VICFYIDLKRAETKRNNIMADSLSATHLGIPTMTSGRRLPSRPVDNDGKAPAYFSRGRNQGSKAGRRRRGNSTVGRNILSWPLIRSASRQRRIGAKSRPDSLTGWRLFVSRLPPADGITFCLALTAIGKVY
jgi:hypothetical protein